MFDSLAPFRNVRTIYRMSTAGTPFHTCHQLLEDLRETADRAHHGTSFSSEQRAASFVDSYSRELAEDLAVMRQVYGDQAPEVAEYESRYRSHARAWLSAKGSCISTMIAGPSNFPVRRAQKANRSEELRYQEWREFREKAYKRAAKVGKEPVTAATELEAARQKLASLERNQELMKAVNKIIKKAKGADCTAEIMAAGMSEAAARKIQRPDVMRNIGFASYSLTNNNAEIRRMRTRVADLEAKAAAAAAVAEAGEAAPITFDGGEIVLNFEADRLQILFDGKPDEATRSKLKSNGFRWAPSSGSWQRKLTEQAKRDAAHITGADMNPAPRLVAPAPAPKPSETATTKAMEKVTENGFLVTVERVTMPALVFAQLNKIYRHVKAATLPTGTTWKEWQPLAEAVDAIAGELAGPLLTSFEAGKIGVWFCADWQDAGQPVLAIGHPNPEPAPEPEPEKPTKKDNSPAALAPEVWAAQEVETVASVDTARLSLLADYHGPATVAQLATLASWHPLTQAQPAAPAPVAEPAPVPAPAQEPAPQLVPDERPGVLEVQRPQVGQLCEYQVEGRQLANGFKIPTFQFILDVNEAGDVLTAKDGWRPAGSFTFRNPWPASTREASIKDWSIWVAGRQWVMVGRPLAKTPATLTQRQATSSARLRIKREAERVAEANAETMRKWHAAGPLVAMLYPAPELRKPRYTTLEDCNAHALSIRDDFTARRRQCAADSIREIRRRMRFIDPETLDAYNHHWNQQTGGLGLEYLSGFLTNPGSARERQKALDLFPATSGREPLKMAA